METMSQGAGPPTYLSCFEGSCAIWVAVQRLQALDSDSGFPADVDADDVVATGAEPASTIASRIESESTASSDSSPMVPAVEEAATEEEDFSLRKEATQKRDDCALLNGVDVQPSVAKPLVSDECTMLSALERLDVDPFQVGDLVMLGNGAPQEYRSCPAVITKVADLHCTVAVLDEAQCGIGECWPGFYDISVTSRAWRLGARVVVKDMLSDRTKHLNGQVGVVSAHPRNGHPSFVRKRSRPDEPQLVLCIVFENPEAARERSALLEPRFLKPFDQCPDELSQLKHLGDMIACLSYVNKQSDIAADVKTTV